MRKILLPALITLICGCSQSIPSAQEIVDKAIEYSGVASLQNAEVTFGFRNMDYSYLSKKGEFKYSRTQMDSVGNRIVDVLDNNGFTRYVNNEAFEVTSEKQKAYTSSVNSVIYFAFLPLHLNDVAVNKSYEGTASIQGKDYFKLKVTFDATGGGEDYEDVFYYWFDTEDYSMDYLAYSYDEDEGKGVRFRVAYNPRNIKDVLIQDYINLKPKVKGNASLESIDRAFINGDLVELSRIELKDIVVELY